MTDDHRKRRSSFFQKPIEETSEKQLELFHNMIWVDEEKESIISKSTLFGNQGQETLKEYTELLIDRKKEYPKLIFNKEEQQIHLKEKLRKNKIDIDWETACKGLTDFERDFTNNIPDYKCLLQQIQSLNIHTALVMRTNYELHEILNACYKLGKEEIRKLQEFLVDKIVEDSGFGTSYYDSDTNSLSMDFSENEDFDSNKITEEP